jgi:hypothetical protein
VRWCGSPARRKTKAAARHRGSRGTRGSRCSRRRWVRLLPRAAPVFAADASFHGRLHSSFSPFTPFSSGRSMGGQGSNSPRRLGLGRSPGLCGGLNSGTRRGTRGWLGCARRHRARRDGEARGRRARLWLWSSAKATKVGDDAAMSSRGRVTR